MNANHSHHMHRALPPHPHTMQPTVYRPSSYHSTPASFPILAVAVVGIVATAFLLICYYIFVIKCCLNFQRFRYYSRFTGSGGRPQGDTLVVYATAPLGRGLEESVIRAIPIIRLKRAQDGQEKAVTECAVCLCEFHEDEKLRLLPNCNHAFHMDCIDTWLQCNANCPICRSSITTTTCPFDPSVISPLDDLHSPIQSITDTGRDLVIEVADLELHRSGLSLDNSQVQASMSARQQPSPKKLEQWLQSKKQRRFDQLSSKGDECIDVRRRVDDEFQVQPIRRSFSMDSSGDGQLYLQIREVLQQNPQFVEGSGASYEGSSSSGSTSRLRRSFLSFGHGRASRSAVLPVQDSA